MTIKLKLRKDTSGRMQQNDLSTHKKSRFTPTDQSLKPRFSLGFYSLTINNYQEVQLRRSDGKNTIRDPQLFDWQGIRATQYDTPVISYGCQAVTSHIAGAESSSQTLAEQDNTCSPPHQDHDGDPTLSKTHTQSAISAWTQHASKTQFLSRLCHGLCFNWMSYRCSDAIVCVSCQLLCRLHCDSNRTFTLPRLAHEGKHVYGLLKLWCVLWLVWELTSWVPVSRVPVSTDDSGLYWETELSISSGRL